LTDDKDFRFGRLTKQYEEQKSGTKLLALAGSIEPLIDTHAGVPNGLLEQALSALLGIMARTTDSRGDVRSPILHFTKHSILRLLHSKFAVPCEVSCCTSDDSCAIKHCPHVEPS